MKRKFILTMTLLFAFLAGANFNTLKAQDVRSLDLSKQYRVKATSLDKYFYVLDNDQHPTGPNGGVVVSQSIEDDNQLFTLEDAGGGAYYFKSASGYYIYCQSWNVDAYSTTAKTALKVVDQGDGTFYLQNTNNDKYFKVEQVGWYYYPFCDCDGSNCTIEKWTLEAVDNGDEPEPTPNPGNSVTIGSGSSTDNTMPTRPASDYSATQQIYTASEINHAAGAITKIAFKGDDNLYGFVITRNWEVYLANTDKTAFASTSDWVTSGFVKVFDDQVTIPSSAGWFELSFTNNFNYTGNNIALCVIDKTGNSGEGVKFYICDGSSLSVRGSGPYDINSLPTASSQYSFKNQIQLTFAKVDDGLQPAVPQNLTCTVTHESVTLTWSVAENADTYNIYQGGVKVGETANTSYTVIGLNPETTYVFTVTGVHDNKESDHSDEVNATTTAAVTTRNIVFFLEESYGDSWQGNYVAVYYNEEQEPRHKLTITEGNVKEKTEIIAIPEGTKVRVFYRIEVDPNYLVSSPGDNFITVYYQDGSCINGKPSTDRMNGYDTNSGNDFQVVEFTVGENVLCLDAPYGLYVIGSTTLSPDQTTEIRWTAPSIDVISYNIYSGSTLIAENITDTSYDLESSDLTHGYNDITVSAVYAEGESEKSDPISIRALGWFTLNVNVTDGNGDPVAGATVQITGGKDELGNIPADCEFTTDANGQVTAKVLSIRTYADSEYTITVSKNRYETVVNTFGWIDTQHGSTLTKNITIELQGPSNVVATPNQLFVGESTTITWDNAGDGVTYNVYVDGVKHNTSAISTNSYTISDLSYNMNPGHVVGVTAVYAEGETSKSTVDVKVAGTFTLTVNVTNQQGQPIQGATVSLDTQWALDEFNNSVAADGDNITDVNGQAVYQDMKLLYKSTYNYYQVNVSKGVFGEASQAITNYAEITNGDNYVLNIEMSLPAPRSVSATGGNSYEVEDDVELTWEKPEGVTNEVIGYNIYKVEGGYGGSYTKLNGSLVEELTYIVTNVESGQYSLGVSAVYAEGESSVTSYYINVAGRARLIGTVVNAEDDPISGAEIVVYGYDMSYNAVRYDGITTDKNGKFTIDPIAPSDNNGYTIEATALGYYDYVSDAGTYVANDIDTKITIVMRSEPSVDIVVKAVDRDTYADVHWDWPMTGELETQSADLYRLDVASGVVTELATELDSQDYEDSEWDALPDGEYQYGVVLSVEEEKQHLYESFESIVGIEWRSEDPTKWSSYELEQNGDLTTSDRGRWVITEKEPGGISIPDGEKYAVSPNPYESNSSIRYIMVSPLIDLREAYLPELSFYYHTPESSSSTVNGLKVLVLTESQGKMAAKDAEQLWYNNEYSTNTFYNNKLSLDLSEYVGEKIYLVFETKLNYMKTYIDLIEVKSQTQSWNSRITWSNSLVKGTVVFTGTGNWNETARWSTGVIPEPSDDVAIKGQVTVDSEVSVNSITIMRNESVMGSGDEDEYSMTLEPTAVLRVTKGIANSGSASNLLIKDGAQLYQNAANVDATFVMNIDNPATWETDHKQGWQIIASPLKKSSTNSFKPADSDYDLYKYEGTQELEWVNHKFHTTHNPSLLYDFEDGTIPEGFTFPRFMETNSEWKLSSETPMGSNIIITSGNIGSNYCLYSETIRNDSPVDLKIDNWVVLPEQRIVNGTYLRFKAVGYHSPGDMLGQVGSQYIPESLEIWVSENSSDNVEDFTLVKEISIVNGIAGGNTSASWEAEVVDLSEFAEKNVYIAFRHKKMVVYNISQAVFIDDIRLINETFSMFEEDFVQGRGYMASYESETQAVFTGELNHESEFRFKDVKGYNGGDRYENFYLLGNPFTFNMNWDGIEYNAIVEGYATVDLDGSYQYFKDGEIKVGDGFFVQTIGNDPYIEYTTTRRRIEKNYLNLIVTGKNGDDNIIIDFSGSEKEGFNKLENFNDEIAELYIFDDGYRYAIKNFDADVQEVEVRFDAKQMGRYTISAIAEGEFETVILVDRMTGIETNLLTEDYAFTSTADEAKDRFIVKFANGQQTTDNSQFVYQSGEELIINAQGMIQIVDVLGRVVYQSEHFNDINRIGIENFDNASYVVRCVSGKEVKTQKIVIL